MIHAGKIRFLRLCHEELSRQKVRDGIGLLAEKRLHGVFKRWICEDEGCHEVRVSGGGERARRFVADVQTKNGEIFEIQIGDLYPMREKLTFYMENTAYPITVVHPLIAKKHISWMDPETGELAARRRSPLRQTPLVGLAQLKPFISYLGSPRFSVCFPLIEVDEYRLLDGWGRGGKRGSHRYELMPVALTDTCMLRTREDYLALFPCDAALNGEFTARDFAKCTRLRGYDLYDALAVFEGLGQVVRCGKQGRATLYKKIIQ